MVDKPLVDTPNINSSSELEKLARDQRHLTLVILGVLVVFNLVVSSLGLLSFLATLDEAGDAKETSANVKEILESDKKEEAEEEKRRKKALEEAYIELQQIFREETAALDTRNQDRYQRLQERIDILGQKLAIPLPTPTPVPEIKHPEKREPSKIADKPSGSPPTITVPGELPQAREVQPFQAPRENTTATSRDYPGSSDSNRRDTENRAKEKK